MLRHVSAERNLEVVRRLLDAIGDPPDKTRGVIAEFWDPRGDYYPIGKFPEAVPCHGREEISRWFVRYRETWADYEHAIKDVVAVGDDRVLVSATLGAKGHGSGIRLEGDIYYCVWLRNEHVLRWEDHLTLRGALHGLGLKCETLEAVGLRR